MKKRIYLILANENLFHPFYLLGILSRIDKKKYTIVGITIAKDHYKNGFINFVKSQYALWGLTGFIAIGVLNYLQIFLDRINYKNRVTLHSVAKRHNIPVIYSYNVNANTHLQNLKRNKIDIIISSNGQIFKKELLALPKIACINRHTALLPKYAGVLPVFWAMKNREKEFGVSIHYMKKQIDTGDIVAQSTIPFHTNNSLFMNYILGFYESVDATLTGIENAVKKKVTMKYSKSKRSYYSFPTTNDYTEFKKTNTSFRVSDLRKIYEVISLLNASSLQSQDL